MAKQSRPGKRTAATAKRGRKAPRRTQAAPVADTRDDDLPFVPSTITYDDALDRASNGLAQAEHALTVAANRDPVLSTAARLVAAMSTALHHHERDAMARAADQLLRDVNASRPPNPMPGPQRPILNPHPANKSEAAERLRDRVVKMLCEQPPLDAAQLAFGLEIARVASNATMALPASPIDPQERIARWTDTIAPLLARHDATAPGHSSRSTAQIAAQIVRRCARASGVERADNLFAAELKRCSAS